MRRAAAPTTLRLSSNEKEYKILVAGIALSLTLLALITSFPVIYIFSDAVYAKQCDCEDLLHLPKAKYVILLGLAVTVFSLNVVSFAGTTRYAIPRVLVATVPAIVVLVLGLGLLGAHQQEAAKIPGSPAWLRSKMGDGGAWPAIRTCLYEARTCEDLMARTLNLKSDGGIHGEELSSTEAACCRPPPPCEMEFVNVTYWRRTLKETDDNRGGDCNLWDNKESILCFNCDTCKQGYEKSLKGKWREIGSFLTVSSVVVIIVNLLIIMGVAVYERCPS
ncbi:unnamed protein product [Cuscuta epithymum]|uniref:Uncharacterized protein n=1 Tax=Cuscuta epithymum TaxID=186058 RepID=A0AAV0FZ50_9ASTE|nr:unnamed protein product [Cuscuta epithymum]